MPGGTFNDIVRLFLSLELTLTFPIVIKPASEVAEEIMEGVLRVRRHPVTHVRYPFLCFVVYFTKIFHLFSLGTV